MVGSALFNLLIIPSAVIGTLLYTKQKEGVLDSLSARNSLWRDAVSSDGAKGLLLVLSETYNVLVEWIVAYALLRVLSLVSFGTK